MSDRLRDTLEALDLRLLVAQLWGEGKRSGRAVIYRAHWRDDGQHASFAVYANGFKDFGSSGESGGVIRFIEREFNLSRPDALAWLRDYLNLAPQQITPSLPMERGTGGEGKESLPSPTWQTCLREAVQRAQQILWSPAGSKALDYLRRDRRLSDATIRAAGLGYAPGFIKTNYANTDETGSVRTVSIPPGIVIPWESDGVLWAVRVRSRVGNLARALNIPDDTFTTGSNAGEVVDKYRSARGSKPGGALYGVDHLRAGLPVILFEGEFDTLLAQQELGADFACVTFGSASSVPKLLPARWRGFFDEVPAIYSALDADAAGTEATNHLTVMFGKRHRTLKLPPGAKDITEAAQNGADISLWAQTAAGEHVPDSWITALLHLTDSDDQHRGAGAPIYYGIMQALNFRHIRASGFTVAALITELKGLGLHFSSDLVRDGLHVLVENGLIDKTVAKIDSTFDPKMSKNLGGRPADEYSVPALAQRRANLIEALAPRVREMAYPVEDRIHQPATIADLTSRALSDVGLNPDEVEKLHEVTLSAKQKQAELRRRAAHHESRLQARLIAALDESTNTPLPFGWRLDTLYLFRVAFLRALKMAGRMGSSLNDIALTLGVSKPSVNKLVGAAGFSIETDQRAAVPLNRSGNIERQVRAGASAVQGKPLTLETYYADGTRRTLSYSSEAAYAALNDSQAQTVRVIYQVANKHTLIENAAAPRPIKRVRPTPASPRIRDNISSKSRGNTPQNGRISDADSAYENAKTRRAGYRRAWVEGQIKLCFRVMGLTVDGGYVDPDSGEILDRHTDLTTLFRVLVKSP